MNCEACGIIGNAIRVRTTNGGLRLCEQCLGDINRKNPEVKRLREWLSTAIGCMFCYAAENGGTQKDVRKEEGEWLREAEAALTSCSPGEK